MENFCRSQSVTSNFFEILRGFYDVQSDRYAKKLLEFLKNPYHLKAMHLCAISNPHPKTHDNFQFDLEALITALESFLERKVSLFIVVLFLEEIRSWLCGE